VVICIYDNKIQCKVCQEKLIFYLYNTLLSFIYWANMGILPLWIFGIAFLARSSMYLAKRLKFWVNTFKPTFTLHFTSPLSQYFVISSIKLEKSHFFTKFELFLPFSNKAFLKQHNTSLRQLISRLPFISIFLCFFTYLCFFT